MRASNGVVIQWKGEIKTHKKLLLSFQNKLWVFVFANTVFYYFNYIIML